MYDVGFDLEPIIQERYSQWEFQDPKMEGPIPYIRPIVQAYVRGYPPKYGLKNGTVPPF